MTVSTLPLSYCTNVHPGRSVEEVERGIDELTLPVKAKLGEPLAAGLWLAQPVTQQILEQPDGPARFAEKLASRGLSCHTLNAFPYGDFHDERVKENVYLPDWSESNRLEYTRDCASILAEMLPPGGEGSISTVPLGFKGFSHPEGFLERCIEQLIQLASFLAELHEQTGRLIRLAIEPEPFCLLETTAEAVAFFDQLWRGAEKAAQGDVVREHIGLCFDVCHQAVEFEDIPQSIQSIDAAGLRINKLHISCAVQIDAPGENEAARRALADYVEPRYLHQTMGLNKSGQVLRQIDLTRELALEPSEDFKSAQRWRIHFHVPIDAESLGPLGTTRGELREAINEVARLPYAPHLEVETYTWEVLPESRRRPVGADQLIEGLTRELASARQLLNAAATQ